MNERDAGGSDSKVCALGAELSGARGLPLMGQLALAEAMNPATRASGVKLSLQFSIIIGDRHHEGCIH